MRSPVCMCVCVGSWEGDVTAICTHHIHPCPSSEVRTQPAHPRGSIESGESFSCPGREVPAAAQMTRAQVTTLALRSRDKERTGQGVAFFSLSNQQLISWRQKMEGQLEPA